MHFCLFLKELPRVSGTWSGGEGGGQISGSGHLVSSENEVSLFPRVDFGSSNTIHSPPPFTL